MFRRVPLRRRSLAAAAAALLALAPAAASAQLSSVAFFGDSFTDTGNGDFLAGLLLGTDLTPSPPYAPGRASNGFVWADYLAAALGRPLDAGASILGGRNFAVGTARTGLGSAGPFPLNMRSQAAALPPFAVDPTGLYAVFGGANDIGDALGSATPLADLAGAAFNIRSILDDLYADGARSFLVPNIPNVGLVPQAVGTPASGPLSALTMAYNAALAANLMGFALAHPDAQVFGLDLHLLFENVLSDAAGGGTRYGLTNTTIPCFGPGPYTTAPVPPPPAGTPSCDVSVFVDGEHVTTRAHQLIADAAYRRVVSGVDVQAVPEPATLALVAGGLAVLGVAARRARRG